MTKARGVAAVELGLVLTLLLTLALGVAELGRAAYEYNTVIKGVRDAARFLTLHTPGSTARRDQARCLVVHGNTTCAGPRLAPSLNTGLVTVCDSVFCPSTHSNQSVSPTAGTVDLVTVTVAGYAFVPLLSFVLTANIPFGPISATFTQL